MSGQYVRYPSSSGSGVNTYASFAALPASASDGTLAITLDTHNLYEYNAGTLSWMLIASPSSAIQTVSGTYAAPLNITAAGGVPFTSTTLLNSIYVQGNGGPITITANPRIAAGTTVGQQIILYFRSDTNTLTLANGNGIDQNGPITGTTNNAIGYEWNGTSWYETWRRG